MPPITSANNTPASPFCFGTMQFGSGSDEAQSAATFHACRDAGINFFDTAWVYNGGKSETILGDLAKSDRENLILTTKGAATVPATRQNITAQLNDSLKRLQTDYIDLYFLHQFDDTTPLQETFDTLADLKSAGKINAIGVSNYAAWQVMKAQSIAQTLGIRIDAIQPMYNLVKRQAEVELLPMCLSENIHVTPYSPLGGGLLTGKYTSSTPKGRLLSDDRYAARYAPEQMHKTAQDLTKLAAEMNLSPATLAVAWVAANPAITAPIISARTTDQLAPSLAAMTRTLTPDEYAAICALSPTPAPATDRLEEA